MNWDSPSIHILKDRRVKHLYGVFDPTNNSIDMRLPPKTTFHYSNSGKDAGCDIEELNIIGLLVHELTHWAQYANMTLEEWWRMVYDSKSKHMDDHPIERMADEMEVLVMLEAFDGQ